MSEVPGGNGSVTLAIASDFGSPSTISENTALSRSWPEYTTGPWVPLAVAHSSPSVAPNPVATTLPNSISLPTTMPWYSLPSVSSGEIGCRLPMNLVFEPIGQSGGTQRYWTGSSGEAARSSESQAGMRASEAAKRSLSAVDIIRSTP
ncbi:hypothetical protein [Nannocystis pusilla]|uniref:hypothetical protein n=1 Tax=Nannocystis pusilla TaxID=889268 RepID=UPI003B81A8AE